MSFVGNDVLDIGSRKAAAHREATDALVGVGRPGQFDVPNVMDVSAMA